MKLNKYSFLYTLLRKQQQLHNLQCAYCYVFKTNITPALLVKLVPYTFLTAITLSGCSSVKQYFPDKEKDYQLNSEIPALTIPKDLSGQTSQEKMPTELTDYSNQEEIFEIKGDEETISVEWVVHPDGIKRIRISDSSRRSWRIVGKALSRQSIEIIDRDAMDNVYFVQYDPDFERVEDGSIWDEILFIFGSDPAKERKFGVKLFNNKGFTEISVHDHKDKPISEGTGLTLLNLLYETITKDLETQTK